MRVALQVFGILVAVGGASGMVVARGGVVKYPGTEGVRSTVISNVCPVPIL